jgi:hypothetical protein
LQQQKIKATKTKQHTGQDDFLSIRNDLRINLFGLQHLADSICVLVYMLQKAQPGIQPFREGKY